MKANYRVKRLNALLLVVFITASCVARSAYKKRAEADTVKDFATAMQYYRKSLAINPTDIEYKLKYEQARFASAFQHFQTGRRALDRGELEVAKAEFERAIKIDPTLDFARKELADVERLISGRVQNPAERNMSFEE